MPKISGIVDTENMIILIIGFISAIAWQNEMFED